MTTFDNHSLLGYSVITAVISENTTTLVVDVQEGEGSRFSQNQQVTIWPTQAMPTLDNAMIGRVTGISGDRMTVDISSSNREGSSIRLVEISDQISNAITPKIFIDLETDVNTKQKTLTNRGAVQPST